MKKHFLIAFLLGLALSLTACSNAQPQTGPSEDNDLSNDTAAPNPIGDVSRKMLVAYYTMPEPTGVDAVTGASRVVVEGAVVGSTQLVAQWISEEVGGVLFAIETAQTYPSDHDKLTAFANEEKLNNVRPTLATKIENLDEYEIIFVGYPNWWGDLPMPVYSFFENYDFSGKTIIPFNTHGGSRLSNTIATIAELEPDATVVQEALTVSRNDVRQSQETVLSWLGDLLSKGTLH